MLFIIFGYTIFIEDGGSQTIAFAEHAWLFAPLIIFNLGTMILGYIYAKSTGIRPDGAFTISIELGLQNAALAIFIATQILEQVDAALIAIMYSSFSFFSTFGVAWFLKKFRDY